MPEIGISENEINTCINLDVPPGWNTYKIGKDIGISVDVISNEQIAFQRDYGAKIYILKEKEWAEVSNIMKYPEGYVLLSRSNGDPFKQGTAVVFPVIPESDKAVTVRIILIGNIYRDGQISDEQTAGYIDVELKP